MPPTLFQKKTLWAAITALSIVAIGGVAVFGGWLAISILSYLQPVLTPLAIAGILAYLLEPVVRFLERRRFSRIFAVITVFLAFTALGMGIVVGVVPSIWRQAESFVLNLPEYSVRAQIFLNNTWTTIDRVSKSAPFRKESSSHGTSSDLVNKYTSQTVDQAVAWVQKEIPVWFGMAGEFLKRSLGVFGFLLSLILVPIFLFFFLKEGPAIARNWSKYLPLRASPLKSEIVSLVTEINSYLINFFRGQLMVSMIDGFLIGVSLFVVGLDFALLIGLMVGVLGLVPYIGMMICWIPAVIIAAVQFGHWWPPVLVTIIFIAANNIDGMIIAPKIVGDSVGLHPLTVIISVLAWSLILGGLLGALLAVPLTATLKVLLKRYFWDRPHPVPPSPS